MRLPFIAAVVVASLGCASAQEPGFEFERWCEATSAIACDADGCHGAEITQRTTIALNVERNGELCVDGACSPFSFLPSGSDRFSGSLTIENGEHAGEWQLTVSARRYSFVLLRPTDTGATGWSGRCGVKS